MIEGARESPRECTGAGREEQGVRVRLFVCFFTIDYFLLGKKRCLSVAKVVLVASMALGHMDDAGTRVHTPI